MGQRRNEWVIHIWGKKRDTHKLNDVEKFHLDMLKMLQPQQKMFDKIFINVALDDINDVSLFVFLKTELKKVLVNDNVEFRYCQNEKDKGEYVTFKPYVFDRIGEDVNIFYSHFKGYKSCFTINKESFPTRIVDLCEMFWTYIMYRYSLDMEDVKKNLEDKCVYCWFILKNSEDDYNIGFYNDYFNCILKGDERYKEFIADDLHKHSPGSFQWYNLKKIGEVLKDKPLITSITTDFLVENSEENKVNLCTHFSETYLMNFFKDDECYSVKDYNKEMHEMVYTLYTGIYPLKKIGREFLKDFEKYLIDNQLI